MLRKSNFYSCEYDKFINPDDPDSLTLEFNNFVDEHHIYSHDNYLQTQSKKKPSMLEGVVSTYLALVARVMGPSGNDPDPIEHYTKLFLTKAHELDIFLCPSSLKQKGTLCRQPNYLTLLNLLVDVLRFGPLRFYGSLVEWGKVSFPE